MWFAIGVGASDNPWVEVRESPTKPRRIVHEMEVGGLPYSFVRFKGGKVRGILPMASFRTSVKRRLGLNAMVRLSKDEAEVALK